jgi:hypothetical protein
MPCECIEFIGGSAIVCTPEDFFPVSFNGRNYWFEFHNYWGLLPANKDGGTPARNHPQGAWRLAEDQTRELEAKRRQRNAVSGKAVTL